MKSSFSGCINSVKTLTTTEGRKVKDTQAVMKFNRLTFPFYIHFNPLKLKPFKKAMCSRVQRDNNQGLVQRDKKKKNNLRYSFDYMDDPTFHIRISFEARETGCLLPYLPVPL